MPRAKVRLLHVKLRNAWLTLFHVIAHFFLVVAIKSSTYTLHKRIQVKMLCIMLFLKAHHERLKGERRDICWEYIRVMPTSEVAVEIDRWR